MTSAATMTEPAFVRRRWPRAAAGAALVAAGVVGLSLSVAVPVAAESDDEHRHEAMHRMMDTMHGDGAADRMHDAEGGEQMMDECASMHSMGSMMGRSGGQ